ncbi:DEAD/DEAH box helicase [Alienimonas sp. DA493]|uniref:DEAD/DEAH box helicase n=1 Tax=Alienimonas sp. DA493 TaxID=3373605 RepID=UPI003754FFC9
MMTALHDVLDGFREDARNNRDLGDRFERLMLRYFEIDPVYADRFDKVWMWNDWPNKGKVGDVGIDLVARDAATGEHCAIQCKFYLPEHQLSKADIDSFITAMGRTQFTSGIIVSTTDKWGKNALDALHHQTKPVTRIGIANLGDSAVDWSTFKDKRPQDLGLREKKVLRPHQKIALENVVAGLENADRGKLIMACGTGKTFTSLRIAEAMAPTGNVLFLVPSLSLLAQSLREWTAEAENGLTSIAVCSDANIGTSRKPKDDDSGDITIQDLAFPATTSQRELVRQFKLQSGEAKNHPTVVFSTYHSIEAVAKAQEAGLPEFDLVICDEAHRTTGVTFAGEDESHFVKVHDADFLRAKKRLYMTATPRIYGDDAKSKAKEAAAVVASMDDVGVFGRELHRLGFGEAVKHDLLADYKVLVLAVDEKYVARTFQKQLAADGEMNLDDATRITGCWNGLEKRFESTLNNPDLQSDAKPMRRAVAFSQTIKASKQFVEQFHRIVEAYKEDNPDADDVLDVEADHVDGSFDALRRNALLEWLKEDADGNACRILSNARCLSEGVDVPALDAVMFLNPRNSVVDVVQSVGRVMRRAEGKRFGYIILPIGIPADQTPEDALKDNKKYKVVWQVLQALRAHDDRFNATINQIELNRNKPPKIDIIGVGGGDGGDDGSSGGGDSKPKPRITQGGLAFPGLEDWKDAIYAKIVKKVGDRGYWETWAKDIAVIAERHVTRIKALLEDENAKHAVAFAEFLEGLRRNLNPAVSADEAIEMLAQHLITRPVFDALFSHYDFAKHNPVSQSMQRMLDLLDAERVDKEAETLERFYASVRDRAAGLDNAEARQKVITELYEEFFRNAFPRVAERLGIVYTPPEVVDFVIRSVEDVLRDEFDSGLGEEDVHIIDPFTGTGTFIVRLLQSGLIPKDKLLQKFRKGLHANEIVLLAYYIAAINIEETFHALSSTNDDDDEYEPFDGIVLTDTFQLCEDRQNQFEGTFPVNSGRAQRQQQSPIRVVVANPPYSAQQQSENDNNKGLDYPALNARIAETYAAASNAKLHKNLYDSYVRAIRWASDRIKDKGVIGFVTNGSFIEANNMDGLRGCLTDEFTSLYVLNLRGNQRTSGETSRKEGGKIFGSGSRATVAITLLIKNPGKKPAGGLHYHDIGDYLSRDEKLGLVRKFASIRGVSKAKQWRQIKPNAENDWIDQRDPAFDAFTPMGDKEGLESVESLFVTYSLGVVTGRDAWVYNASRAALEVSVVRLVESYQREMSNYQAVIQRLGESENPKLEDVVESDQKLINWTRALKADARKGKALSFEKEGFRVALYRPFFKRWMYFNRRLNEVVYKMPRLFPTERHANLVIAALGAGASHDFSVLISDTVVDLEMVSKGQCFPRFYYERADVKNSLGFEDGESELVEGFRRRDGITSSVLDTFQASYDNKLTKDDIFYYVYGILHSAEYRERFAANLKKALPRIPLTRDTADFWAFTQAGRDLADLHLNYETVKPWGVSVQTETFDFDPWDQFKVEKMRFARPSEEQKTEGLKHDKSTIVYNAHVTIKQIPLAAYEYVVNGKPAIEWVMDRYKVTVDKKSGIRNDPNDWCREHDDPRYIVDLIGRIVRVSMETMDIVRSLPALNEREGA